MNTASLIEVDESRKFSSLSWIAAPNEPIASEPMVHGILDSVNEHLLGIMNCTSTSLIPVPKIGATTVLLVESRFWLWHPGSKGYRQSLQM